MWEIMRMNCLWTLLKILLQCSIVPSYAALWHHNGESWHHVINCDIRVMDCIITVFCSATTMVRFALTMVNRNIKQLNCSITNQCSFHPLSKKHHFAADRDKCRDLRLAPLQNTQTIGAQYLLIWLENTPYTPDAENMDESKKKYCKSQTTRVPATRLCLYNMGKLNSKNLSRMVA